MSHSAHTVGSVVGLWRYPVKSMIGEELNATEVDVHGLLDDRAHALVDRSEEKRNTRLRQLGPSQRGQPRRWASERVHQTIERP
jgi:uncharacterized protein YcbX